MKKLYKEEDVQAIANIIREKNSSTDTYNLAEMSNAIRKMQIVSNFQIPVVLNNELILRQGISITQKENQLEVI